MYVYYGFMSGAMSTKFRWPSLHIASSVSSVVFVEWPDITSIVSAVPYSSSISIVYNKFNWKYLWPHQWMLTIWLVIKNWVCICTKLYGPESEINWRIIGYAYLTKAFSKVLNHKFECDAAGICFDRSMIRKICAMNAGHGCFKVDLTNLKLTRFPGVYWNKF